MVTVNSNDSIFWEEAGNGEASVRSRLISEEDMVKQASEFCRNGSGKTSTPLLENW